MYSFSSFVWRYFKTNDVFDTLGGCKLCHKNVKCGSTPKTISTTPLHMHLKKYHLDTYDEAKQEKQKREKKSKAETPRERKLKQITNTN